MLAIFRRRGRGSPRACVVVIALTSAGLRPAMAQPQPQGDGTASAASTSPGQQQAKPAPDASRAITEPTVEVDVLGERPHPGQGPRLRGVAAAVLTGERLAQPGATTAHALREVPGLQITEVGGLGAPATASVRGATAAQTPIYLGGVRINDEVGGSVNLADVPLFLIERAEIYRSHAPLAADRFGIGGAIFFDPRRATEDELTAGAELGSFGSRAGWLYGAAAHGRRGLLAGFKLAAADNDYTYFDDRGTLLSQGDDSVRRLGNADARIGSAFVHATEPIGSAELTVLYHHNSREQGAPKLALVPSREARVEQRRDLVAVRADVPMKAWDGALQFGTQAVSAETEVSDPVSELGLLTPHTRTPGERIEEHAEASQRIGSLLRLRQRLSVAVDRLQRWERRNGVEQQALSARRLTSRLASAAELSIANGLYVDGTAALTCMSTSLDALTLCGELLPVGRIGGGYRNSGFEVYGSVGRYFRNATLGELYGASLLVRGNPLLVSEVGTTVEVGVRLQSLARDRAPQLWLDASAFARYSDDLITYVRTAQGYLLPLNRESSLSKGGELVVGVRPLPWIEATTQATFLDARDTSTDRLSNTVLPFASRLLMASLLTLRLPLDHSIADEGGITGKWLYQSNRYADRAGLMVIPEQTSTDLELWIRAFARRIVTRARVANLFDARRFDVVGFPLPGRSAFLSLEATW